MSDENKPLAAEEVAEDWIADYVYGGDVTVEDHAKQVKSLTKLITTARNEGRVEGMMGALPFIRYPCCLFPQCGHSECKEASVVRINIETAADRLLEDFEATTAAQQIKEGV